MDPERMLSSRLEVDMAEGGSWNVMGEGGTCDDW